MKRQEHAVSMLTQKEKYYLNIPVFVYFDFSIILVKEITIHSKIYGVAYGEEKFYVACVTEVKILNLKGESVHVIRVPNACIRQVCTDKGRLLFSDWNHNSIQVRERERERHTERESFLILFFFYFFKHQI